VPPPLRPAAVRGDVDVEARGDERAVLADAHRFPDVRRELQLVLQVLRGEQGAVDEPSNIPGAVDDPEMAVLVDDPRVSGMHPAIVDGLPGGVRVIVVDDEDAGAPTQHLPPVDDPELASP